MVCRLRQGRTHVKLLPGHTAALGFLLGVLTSTIVGWSRITAQVALLPLAIILSVFLTTFLHEVVHIVFAKAVGGGHVRVKIIAYRRLIPVGVGVGFSNPLSLVRWSVVALAPLLFLSPILLALGGLEGLLGVVFSLAFLMNAVGSCGDLLLVVLAASAGSQARVMDEGERVVLEGSPRPWAVLLLDLIYIFTITWIVLSALLFLTAPALQRSVTIMGITLVEYMHAGNEVRAGVGPGVLLVALAISLVFEAWKGTNRAQKLLSSFEST